MYKDNLKWNHKAALLTKVSGPIVEAGGLGSAEGPGSAGLRLEDQAVMGQRLEAANAVITPSAQDTWEWGLQARKA